MLSSETQSNKIAEQLLTITMKLFSYVHGYINIADLGVYYSELPIVSQ